MTTKYKYNSWPIGKLPKEFQRQELNIIKEMGYNWTDPRDIIDIFENKVAKFAGCKYGISVDCCSHGLFLCLEYLKYTGELLDKSIITIPQQTYVSVPMQIKHANLIYKFEDIKWSGIYQLKPIRIWDGAVRWTEDMYVGNNSLQVVSFQIKKRIPIGRGGMILTSDARAADWLKLASYDGRDLTTAYTQEDHIKMIGYHYYMTPEDAARGIILMDNTPKFNSDSGNYENYTNLSKINIFN